MGNAMSVGRSGRMASRTSDPSLRATPSSLNRPRVPVMFNDVVDKGRVDQGILAESRNPPLLPTAAIPVNPPNPYQYSMAPNTIYKIFNGGWIPHLNCPVDPSAAPEDSCPNLTGRVQRLSSGPVHKGPYSIVYKGRHGEQQVAVKKIQCLPEDPLHSIIRRFRRERGASRFDHPNILRIYGIIEADWCVYGCIVTPWCQNGDAFTYVRRANLGFSETYQLLCGVAAGLEYLHGLLVVHGDMKPGNILIDDVGNPLITDFGLMCHLDPERPSDVIDNTTTPHLGTIRYLAYELVEPDPPEQRSMASDIHALGCVCYALIYLMEPYAWRLDNKGGHLFRDIAKGMPPASRSETPLEPPLAALWDLMEGCWHQEPTRRPVIDAVRAKLKIIAGQWQCPIFKPLNHSTSTLFSEFQNSGADSRPRPRPRPTHASL